MRAHLSRMRAKDGHVFEHSARASRVCPYARGDGLPDDAVDTLATFGIDLDKVLRAAHRGAIFPRMRHKRGGRCEVCGAEVVSVGFRVRKIKVNLPFEVVEREDYAPTAAGARMLAGRWLDEHEGRL